MSTPKNTPAVHDNERENTRAVEAPQIDYERLEKSGLDELVAVRNKLSATIRRPSERVLTGTMAERRCLTGEVSIPEHLPLVREARAIAMQRIAALRKDLQEQRVIDRARSISTVREEIMAERRSRTLLLSRAEIPRIDESDADAEELAQEWRRLERLMLLVTPEGEAVPGFEPGASRIGVPPTPEGLAALWEAVVIDPERIPGKIGLPGSGKTRMSRMEKLQERGAQMNDLVEMFRTARSLPTARGSISRVLILKGGDLLVTRGNYNGRGDSRLIAKRIPDAIHAEREARHLRHGTRSTARLEEFPWAAELEMLREELAGWSTFSKEERLALGQRCVTFLRGIRSALGAPRMRPLKRIRDILSKIDALANNPGALLASTAGFSRIFEDLARINESRSLTVAEEQEELAVINHEFKLRRNTAFDHLRNFLKKEDIETCSDARVRLVFEATRSTLLPRTPEEAIQPYATMMRDVDALVTRGLELLDDQKDEVRTLRLRRVAVGLYALLKHMKLHAFFEERLGSLTLEELDTAETPHEEAVRTKDPAVIERKIERVTRDIEEYISYQKRSSGRRYAGIPYDPGHELLPGAYRRDRELGKKAQALIERIRSSEASPETRLAKLKEGLRTLDPLGRYHDIARAVREDLNLE